MKRDASPPSGRAARPREGFPRGSRAKSAAGKLLHLDTFSGIAGNMFLAALLDLGLSRRELEQDLSGLGVAHSLVIKKVRRGALAAKYLDVRVPKTKSKQKKAHHHGHWHAADPSRGRHYTEIVRLLERAKLEDPVRERALAIFGELAKAEAKVHGIAVERVHFHEVGAVDAIVDVTGAAIGLHRLGVTSVTATPVALGHGTVETAHGTLPLPAPATLELLRGLPTVPAHVAWETVTPTGAAILRVIADEFRALPAMTIEAIGHGAGDDRPGPMPNLLRAVLGRAGGLEGDRVVALETNLDDLVPEHFDYLLERLLDAGALDVGIQHVQMKKNRPGFLVRVLARPSDRLSLARILLAETTTLGVRTSEFDRLVLERSEIRVSTPYGKVRVKTSIREDGRREVSAEYDDCKRAALKAGVPLRDVVRAAEEAAR